MVAAKKKGFETHKLVPQHEKLSDSDKQKLLSEMNIGFKDLPKIFRSDPAIVSMEELKVGDVIKITRKSSTAKVTTFYRGVIDA